MSSWPLLECKVDDVVARTDSLLDTLERAKADMDLVKFGLDTHVLDWLQSGVATPATPVAARRGPKRRTVARWEHRPLAYENACFALTAHGHKSSEKCRRGPKGSAATPRSSPKGSATKPRGRRVRPTSSNPHPGAAPSRSVPSHTARRIKTRVATANVPADVPREIRAGRLVFDIDEPGVRPDKRFVRHTLSGM